MIYEPKNVENHRAERCAAKKEPPD